MESKEWDLQQGHTWIKFLENQGSTWDQQGPKRAGKNTNFFILKVFN